MRDEPIDLRIFSVALREVGTAEFERFGQAFYAALEGTDFVPLGGTGDGGADGLLDRSIFETQDGSRVLQISKQAGTRAKISQTVTRLKEYGRKPVSLTYLTSRSIQNLDTEEDYLSNLHGLRIRLRDSRYIESHVNGSTATRAAAASFILPAASFLNEIGSRPIISPSDQLPAASLCAFVGQEIENRRGNTELLESVTDSLILWALNDTDPEKQVFKTRKQVLEDIETALPAAKQFIRSVFDVRLERLTKKSGTDGRKINYYKNGDKFCLPFETRQIVAAENAADIGLKERVSEVFVRRIKAVAPDAREDLCNNVVNVCHHTIESAFERRGLEVVQFIKDAAKRDYTATIDELVVTAIEKHTDVAGVRVPQIRSLALEVLRGSFYNSESDERSYFQKLSRTYTLLFMIKNEPKVVEYFRSMTAEFILYVGSDILIRALSEHYLPESDQMTRNMLKLLSASGSTLILTEKTLDEVAGNIRKANNAYLAEYMSREHYMNAEMARHIDHILVRAYFYARHSAGAEKPKGWKNYMNQFADYDEVTRQGKESLREYLCKHFDLIFESLDEMKKGIDGEELEELADAVQELKKYRPQDAMLARNDALQVLRIYRRRAELGDRTGANPLGFRVWWLTQESRIKRATVHIVQKHHGRYLMRPEFLVSFIDVIPSLDEVRRSFSSIFPTILGIRLSNRMSEEDFVRVLQQYDNMAEVNPSRAQVILANLSNKMKGSSRREYEVQYPAGADG